MNFFKTKPRTPPDLVRSLRENLPKLDSAAPGGDVRRKVRSVWHGQHAEQRALFQRVLTNAVFITYRQARKYPSLYSK